MSISPNRKAKDILTAYKQNYFNSNALYSNNLTSIKKIPQEFKSEDINSLNIENQIYKKRNLDIRKSILIDSKKKDKLSEQLQKKLEIIQKHNSHLLAENTSLGQMLAQKKMELQMQNTRFEAQIKDTHAHILQVEGQKNRLLLQMQHEHNRNKQEIQKLLEEISKLHDNYYEIQTSKKNEIQKLKQGYEKELLNQIQNIKRNQNGNVELYETQIRKLKQTIELKDYEIESINQQNKINLQKANEEIKHLNGQIKHLTQMKDLELEECKIHYENEVQNKLREIKRQQELQGNSTQSTIKKLKKELNDKELEIQKLINRYGRSTLQNQSELQMLKDQKQKLRFQIQEVQQTAKLLFKKQKQRLINLSETQRQNLQNTNINYTNSLKSEIQKLYQLTQYKTSQIKQLYKQVNNIRGAHSLQIQYLNKLNQDLKLKLNQLQLKSHQDLQLLKIKISHLHQADVKSIRDYLQNQIKILMEQNAALQKIIQQNRQRIHKQLQQKNILRKNMQIEVANQKAKVNDLKVKLATSNFQMKEQITSMTSKLELTSQTFIRDNKLKQKGALFGEEERKKLHHLIDLKNKQIRGLNESNEKLKRESEQQEKRFRQEIRQLQKSNDALNNNNKKNVRFYEGEIKKIEVKHKQQIQRMNANLQNVKNMVYAQLKGVLQNLQKQNVKYIKNIEVLERQKKKLIDQLNLKNGLIENIQLESCAAIQQQKTKTKQLINDHQNALKSYYQQKVLLKNNQINNYKQQLIQKQQDLKDIIHKYHALQNKLALLLQTQQKLSEFEHKIMNLGMDNNLIKNLAELFKYKQKK